MQHNIRGVSRRTLLTHAGVVAAATAVTSLAPSVATAASIEAPKTASAYVPTSANGWPLEKEANHVSTVWTRPVPGTGLELDIRIGDAEAILLHVIRRFHYEVEPLHSIDLAGWRSIDSLNKSLPESNLASGTAVRIRPGAAAKGSLFPLQEIVVRDILADFEGVVRWGGDDNPLDESLFYLDRGPDSREVRDVARKLRKGETTPGQGAGATADPFSKTRRERAQRLVRQQSNR
ncbi:hypothetical protein [Streptomyces sp. NPDC059744]|uniref:hypothetical protein n=1 Tax=Streptomyces sp. NPDC059744 TaxID=3346929 RepID=UPI0036504ECA